MNKLLLYVVMATMVSTVVLAAPKYSCSDTDGGNLPFTFGTVSGNYNKVPYSYGDYCIDSGNLREYWCNTKYWAYTDQSCGTDYYGSNYCTGNVVYKDLTDYSCGSGICDSQVVPEVVQDCDASDGYYGTNYCLYDNVYQDYLDYYCSGGACPYDTTPTLVEACNWGCTAGVCDPQPNSCSDTDGGINLPVLGTVSGFYINQTYNYTDFCVDSDQLYEYYCGGNYQYGFATSCSGGNQTNYTGCSVGRCV
ncbi:MAG: hypothetical protein ABIJ21_06070 [Nanoarchaeota archaeon]